MDLSEEKMKELKIKNQEMPNKIRDNDLSLNLDFNNINDALKQYKDVYEKCKNSYQKKYNKDDIKAKEDEKKEKKKMKKIKC